MTESQNPFQDEFEIENLYKTLRKTEISDMLWHLNEDHSVMCVGAQDEGLRRFGYLVGEEYEGSYVSFDIDQIFSEKTFINAVMQFAATRVGMDGIKTLFRNIETGVEFAYDPERDTIRTELPFDLDLKQAYEDIVTLLDRIAENEGRLLVIFQGAEYFEELFKEHAAAFVKRLISSHRINCLMLFANDNLRRIKDDDWYPESFSPLFNFEIYRVSERELYLQLAKILEKDYEKPVVKAVLKEILLATHGIWASTVTLGSAVWEELNKTVYRKTIVSEVMKKLAHQRAPLYEYLWSRLTVKEKRTLESGTGLLSFEFGRKIEPVTIGCTVNDLFDQKILSKDLEGQLAYADPFFKNWVEEQRTNKQLYNTDIFNWITVQALKEGEEMIRTGKGKTNTLDELWDSLDVEDDK